MKKKLLYKLLILLFVSILAACSKDLGNYTYHDINQVTFTDFDTTKGYSVLFGQTLSIDPALASTMDAAAGYSYEWSLRLGSSAAPPARDSILSVSKALNVKIGLVPGTYVLQYKVTDKSTGVQFQKRTNLNVTTDVFEGYLVLNDVGGNSRLDMLSYNKASTSFTQITDVLQHTGSKLSMQGQPYQVLCMLWTRPNISAQNYGIWILNASGTNRINQETFAADPTYNIRYLMLGSVPNTFMAKHLTGELQYGISPYLAMSGNDDNMYTYSVNAGYAFKYLPLNTYINGGATFRMSPYVATDANTLTGFNMDKHTFVTTASSSAAAVTDAPAAYNYPSGYDLVYMGKDYNSVAFAILKKSATSQYYLLRFPLLKAQTYFKEILGTDIANATSFAISPDLGYLFYSAGGKVYEYDPGIQKSFLMLDKGTSQISYLDFQNFYNRLVPATAIYKTWANYLTVGSYDPAGTAGKNGTMELYTVPQVNGQIVKVNSWTGFGKIVSVSYRER